MLNRLGKGRSPSGLVGSAQPLVPVTGKNCDEKHRNQWLLTHIPKKPTGTTEKHWFQEGVLPTGKEWLGVHI